MRKHTPGRLLAYGLTVVAVSALAIAGAASGNHWADYNGTADSHQLVADPPLCPPTEGGLSFRLEANQLADGRYPTDSGNPFLRIFDVDVAGGTLSWDFTDLHQYDAATVVMSDGENAMVYDYDSDAPGGGYDDSDSGVTT